MTEDPPFVEPELGTVDALVRMSFLVQGEVARLAAAHDLSLPQVRLLGILRDRRPGMLDLGRHLDLGKSGMTGLVGRAEARGLVRRGPDDADGRGVRVELTDAGRDLAATVTAAVAARVEELLAGFPARDRARLTVLASRLVAGAAVPRR